MTNAAQTPAQDLTDRQARAELSRIIESTPDPAARALIATLGPAETYRLITTGTNPTAATAEAITDHGHITAAKLHATLLRLRLRVCLETEPLDLDALAADGIGILTPEDDQWPTTLEEAGDAAPVALWYRADEFTTAPLDRLPNWHETIAVTGTREMSDYGAKATAEITAELTGYGHTIATGTAYGIEAAALRAALPAATGHDTPAVAVLASGVDMLTPAGNQALLHQVAATGLLLSPVAPGNPPTPERIGHQKALLAALSSAVVIPEARYNCQSVTAVDAAEELDKPIAAVPGSIYSPTSELPNALLSEAGVTAATSAAAIGQMMAYH